MAYIAMYLELYLRNTFQGKELHKNLPFEIFFEVTFSE